MAASNAVRAGAAAAALAIIGGIYVATRTPEVSPSKRRTRVAYALDAGPTSKTRCLRTVVLASPPAMALFGLPADAGAQYAYVKICSEPDDAGVISSLPAGMTAIESTQEEEAYDGGPQLEAVLTGEPEFECACARDDSCEWLTTAADGGGIWIRGPKGTTFGPGRWRGASCLRKTCVELSGFSSMPTECM